MGIKEDLIKKGGKGSATKMTPVKKGTYKVPNVSIHLSPKLKELITKRLKEVDGDTFSKYTRTALYNRAVKDGIITEKELKELR